jgi:hypothetical protein
MIRKLGVIIGIGSAIFLTSCVRPPIEIGLNTYTQSHPSRDVAYIYANETCKRKIKALKIIRERTDSYGHTILDFKCLNPMSEEYRSPSTYESSDKVIETRYR